MKSCSTGKTPLPTNWIIGGAVGSILIILLVTGIMSYSDSPSSNDQGSSQNNSSGQSGGETTNYYPSSGGTQITESSPVRVYINPSKTWVRYSDKGVKFVFEQDNSITFAVGQGMNRWESLPAGNYLVYPYGCSKTGFSWGQGTPPD